MMSYFFMQFGLVLGALGSLVLIFNPACLFIKYKLGNEKAKELIHKTIIAKFYGRWAPDTKEEMLKDELVKNAIAEYGRTTLGFLLLLLGFGFQCLAQFMP